MNSARSHWRAPLSPGGITRSSQPYTLHRDTTHQEIITLPGSSSHHLNLTRNPHHHSREGQFQSQIKPDRDDKQVCDPRVSACCALWRCYSPSPSPAGAPSARLLGVLWLRTLAMTFSREVPSAEGLGTLTPALHSFMGSALINRGQWILISASKEPKAPLLHLNICNQCLWKCCTQYVGKFGKFSSGHKTGKGQFSFQS